MLLLDTHALVWLASDQTQLTAAGKASIVAAAGQLFVSSISGLEIALLVKRGHLELPFAPGVFIDKALGQHGIEEIPVDAAIAVQSASLPDIHNDPFDRVIIASAYLRGCDILSRDIALGQYPDVTVVW